MVQQLLYIYNLTLKKGLIWFKRSQELRHSKPNLVSVQHLPFLPLRSATLHLQDGLDSHRHNALPLMKAARLGDAARYFRVL